MKAISFVDLWLSISKNHVVEPLTTFLKNVPTFLGYYTQSTIMDYPSISHINYVAQQNSFVLIFAVSPSYKAIYEDMANLVTGSSVEILEKDSENIVQIIRERYKGLTSSIQVFTMFFVCLFSWLNQVFETVLVKSFLVDIISGLIDL